MSVMKNCKYRGCRTSPRCRHDWFFDIEYKNSRYSMKVNEYAALSGATHPVVSKQEAREVWEPLDRLDIIAGRDPRASPALPADKPSTEGMTIADFIDQWYIPLYVNVEPLKAARSVRSNCAVLRRLIGQHPLKALEGKDPVDVVKQAYSGHALSTRNRMLSRVRHMTNWARSRDSLGVKSSPFHRDGIRISLKQEVQRDRRMSEVEERALLDACMKLDEPSFHSQTDVEGRERHTGPSGSWRSTGGDRVRLWHRQWTLQPDRAQQNLESRRVRPFDLRPGNEGSHHWRARDGLSTRRDAEDPKQ